MCRFLFVFLFSTRRGGFAPTTTVRVQARVATAQQLAPCRAQGVASPSHFVDLFFFRFFSPSGVFFLSSGLVGLPLPCFSLPPGPRSVSFFWVGWVPLPCFPRFFPHGSWVGGGGVSFFVSPATSCFLHLSSLAARKIWSTDPQTPRPPPALFLGASVLTRLLLGVDGRTHRGKGRGGDRGVCDPAHCLGTMIVAVCVFVFPAGLRTPRNRLWPFRQSSSRFWGFGCLLCATLQLRLGFPLRSGIVFLALRVLHLVLS